MDSEHSGGYDLGGSKTPITPVIVGEGAWAKEFSDGLFENGIFAQSIVCPTVSRETGRVRTMIMATLTKEDLGYALEAFGQVGREMGLVDEGSRT